MTATANAAGATIFRLTLNLSDIRQPCVLVAAIVVSEMNERLSPKNAPPATMAVTKPVSNPDSEAIPAATGTSATMVPTLVPMAMDMKQDARKRPTNSIDGGRMCNVAATVASMAPICLAVSANAPARMNIQSISSTFLCPAPRENTAILSSIGAFLLIRSAYADAIRNAAAMGIL